MPHCSIPRAIPRRDRYAPAVHRIDAAAIGALIRTVAREELGPRFRRLDAAQVFAKATVTDPDDIVTEADLAVERRLEAELCARLPGSVVVGEEAASKTPALLAALGGDAPVWIVDPLDGTRNFAAGKETFGSMVALARGGRTQLAWIYLFAEDALFAAEAGAGAFENGRRLEARPPAPARRTGTVYTRHMPPALRAATEARARDGFALARPVGSAAIEYARLMRGEKDFVVYFRLLPWDHAPGTLLLAEAGGAARRLDGVAYGPTDASQPLLLTRHPSIWEPMRVALFA
jgi:fructose-1,6-bisphosphatase/inositol monophosphatase family enzyme